MREIIETVISDPKTSYFAVFLTNVSNWWVDWGSPIVDAAASLLGIILLVVLIRYHLQKTKELLKSNKNKS